MRMGALIGVISLAMVAAAPAGKVREIPWAPGDDEALVIPAASPLRFKGFNKDHYAQFNGRFVLTGTFIYGCNIECEPPLKKDDVFVDIIPDRSMARLLPYWKLRGSDMRIFLVDGDRLAKMIVTRKDEARLLAGKIPDVRKHVAIVVTDFEAGIECDSPSYSARFISLAKPAEAARAAADPSGCA
jgi:hypothetical protein